MSYAASALPPALLELTLLRVSGATPRLGAVSRWKNALGRRAIHQELATANDSSFQIMDTGLKADRLLRRQSRRNLPSSRVALTPKAPPSSTPRQLCAHPIQELEKRVATLEETAELNESVPQSFFYDENDLLAMYQDLLAVPNHEELQSNNASAEAAVKKAQAESERQIDMMLLQQLEDRLCVNEEGEREIEHNDIPPYRRILLRAQEIVNRADAVRRTANPDASKFRVPIAVLSPREYEALIRASMDDNDLKTAQVALDVAKLAGLPMPEKVLTAILDMYATSGDAQAADRLLADFLTGTPTESQRDLHIKAHLESTPQGVLPISALDLVHQYEENGSPAPMRTYTSVISSLYSRPMSLARAHAWDIFSHMRYVAHPDPDVELYTVMIKACALPVTVAYTSEPEKALDLWTEMTADQKIPPTVAAYNAVILACARSGEKIYVNEAFRLARQMLDTNRDARGVSAFRPNLETFCALLEGCKRIGDLGRARWILVEMVKGGQRDDANSIEVEINDQVMMHVFHAYAAYKPPVIRPNLVSSSANKDPGPVSEVETSPEDSNHSEEAQASQQQTSTSADETRITKEEPEDPARTFSRLPPQSHAQVVREAKMLMKAIVYDISSKPESSPSSTKEPRRFRDVEISPRLLSAYLSVFYNHASFEESRERFQKIFNEMSTIPTARLYVEALEKCANARRGPDRQLAVEFSDELWHMWSIIENDEYFVGKPLEARLIERAHVARIRTLAKANHLSRAMVQLRAFAAKYPPEVIKKPPPKLDLRSTRTSLVGPRPLVRMTTATEVPDDTVPPLMAFRDLEVLHHRLVFEERTKDIGYITWLCRSYEWALRTRKNKATTAKCEKNSIATTRYQEEMADIRKVRFCFDD